MPDCFNPMWYPKKDHPYQTTQDTNVQVTVTIMVILKTGVMQEFKYPVALKKGGGDKLIEIGTAKQPTKALPPLTYGIEIEFSVANSRWNRDLLLDNIRLNPGII
eukprot:Pgem_evm1s9497